MLDDLGRIAAAAGEAILRLYAGPEIASRNKEDGSPVTLADSEAEAIILEQLAGLWPDIPVVAEEAVAAGAVPAATERFFLVDPLDGTKEFLSRNGEFTVNIALVEHGAPVAGVVYAPALGDLYAGSRTTGARAGKVAGGQVGGWSPIAVRAAPASGLDVVASRSHLTEETKRFVERFPVAGMVSAGSSLKFCLVACGKADLYPRLGRTMEWDTAAGDAVLRAAGGMVYDMDGAPLTYGKASTADPWGNPWFVAAGSLNPFAEIVPA